VETNAMTGWVPRVQGCLAVSRALGDIYLKEPIPYVSAEPEVNEVILGPNDQFFLIATDGLWDVMDSQQAVDLIRKCPDKYTASEVLVQKAVKLGTRDNVTALVVWLTWSMEHTVLSHSSSSGLMDSSIGTSSEKEPDNKQPK
jgi:serine/threonine protein phosphatase PrpC